MRQMLLLAVVCCSCTRIDSSTVTTSEIYADMTVTAVAPNRSDVQVVLRTSSDALLNTNIVALSTGDTLTASVGGETRTLSGATVLGYTSYSATFDNGETGARFGIALHRETGDSASDTTVALPAAFQLASSTASASRASAPIELTWSPVSEEAVEVVMSGSCIAEYRSGPQADTGAWTIPAGTVHAATADSSPSCQVTAHVRRTTHGQLDPAFAGGAALIGGGWGVYGVQDRLVQLTSTP